MYIHVLYIHYYIEAKAKGRRGRGESWEKGVGIFDRLIER